MWSIIGILSVIKVLIRIKEMSRTGKFKHGYVSYDYINLFEELKDENFSE